MENWNEICFLLSENIRNDISERDFEQNVVQALMVLGWKEYTGDIEIRPSFQIGAANRIIPDFIIKSPDNKKLFVIEIKQPNIPLNLEFQRQLFSYMRQLGLEYGILIGQVIQIFYLDSIARQEDPILLETIEFTKDNEKGKRFVEVFSKDNFSSELLQAFTKNSLKKINREEEQKKLTEKILSDNFQEKLAELIKQDFLNEYDGEIIDVVLSELIIEVKKKNNNVTRTELSENTLPQPNIGDSNHNNSMNQANKPENELRIGKYVRTTFKEIIRKIDSIELENLQKSDYSKDTFDIQYPFLRKASNRDEARPNHYWRNQVTILGGSYFICQEWFEQDNNNDRPYYERWLSRMKEK